MLYDICLECKKGRHERCYGVLAPPGGEREPGGVECTCGCVQSFFLAGTFHRRREAAREAHDTSLHETTVTSSGSMLTPMHASIRRTA